MLCHLTLEFLHSKYLLPLSPFIEPHYILYRVRRESQGEGEGGEEKRRGGREVAGREMKRLPCAAKRNDLLCKLGLFSIFAFFLCVCIHPFSNPQNIRIVGL